MPSLTATRPAEPFVDAKSRLAAAVDAARPEILDLSHRIHADPEPAFEEHHAAGMGRGGPGPPRVRRRAAGREPGDRGPGHTTRRTRHGRATDRDPRRVRRAAGSGARLRPQHDGRVGGRGRDRARLDRGRAAGRDRLPRDARRGARERQGDHDRGRAVRRPRRRAAVPPVRPHPRREPAAGLGGRRRRLHRAPGACVVGSVEGAQRARRDDRALHLGRAVAPAAPTDRARPRDHPRGWDRGQHHPGADRRPGS